MSEAQILSLRALVRGRVQGVGFRTFVVLHAAKLGLDGYVRNLNDRGTVEIVAEGSRDRLDMLRKKLMEGPRMAEVERIDESWGTASGLYRGFGQR